VGYDSPSDGDEEVNVDARKRAWARLLAKVYEVDPFVCPKCGAKMKCSFSNAKLLQFGTAEL
jgi:tRNA(Ile2) C34 agmatinyltransferase TiaS